MASKGLHQPQTGEVAGLGKKKLRSAAQANHFALLLSGPLTPAEDTPAQHYVPASTPVTSRMKLKASRHTQDSQLLLCQKVSGLVLLLCVRSENAG